MRDTCDIETVTTAGGAEIVLTGKALFYGCVIRTDGTNDVTVVVGDDTATKMTLKADASIDGLCKIVSLPVPFAVTTNLKVTVTGTGGEAEVLFGK